MGANLFDQVSVEVRVRDGGCDGAHNVDCNPLVGVQAQVLVVNDRSEGDFTRTVTLADDRNALGHFEYSRSAISKDTISVTGVTREGFPFNCTKQLEWVANTRGPLLEAAEGASSEPALVGASRGFRDDVLAKTTRGQKYTQEYYEFSSEAVRIMMFNPILMLRSREILQRYRLVIKSMANGEGATLARGDLDEIEGFLTSIAAKGSGNFQTAIKGICNGVRRTVQARYVLPEVRSKKGRGKSEPPVTCHSSLVSFEIGAYDKSMPLIIDPVLTYSTYLGGSGDDEGNSITVDSAGNAYIAGFTDSINFPASTSSQPIFGGGQQDAFVTKLDPSGALVYSTYLGGNFQDNASGIAVDAAGNAYITGDTDSANFPTAVPLQQATAGGVDAFVTKLNSSGTTLVYSTYLGGSGIDGGTAISVDSAGSAYVAGFTDSGNFPLAHPLQTANGGGSFDAFVASLNPSGSSLDYSTYLGGSGVDAGFGIAVDPAGNAYVMGQTDSPNFPTSSPLQQAFGGGTSDLFVSRITAPAQSGPRINRASIAGKNLILAGGGFDVGARILVNGESQKTSNDAQSPSTSLIGKKTGRSIGRGQTVTLQVRNSNGALSPEFHYTRPSQ